MSIAVFIKYTGKNGSALNFAEEMIRSNTVKEIRAEKGNLGYEYFKSLEDEESIFLLDKWENQEALDLHHASPMMKKISELREKYDLHMSVERFVSEDGLPEKDEQFIRN